MISAVSGYHAKDRQGPGKTGVKKGGMKKNQASSPQIMFVDSDPLVRDSLKLFFDSGQTHYLIFKSGREGLNSLKYQPIDVVVSDYFLPDMDGIQFLNQVKVQSSRVFRVLMATLISDELRCEIRAAGIDRCIEKPLTVASLDTIINELACQRKMDQGMTRQAGNNQE
jgi:CheY-like chemotaxis protein